MTLLTVLGSLLVSFLSGILVALWAVNLRRRF